MKNKIDLLSSPFAPAKVESLVENKVELAKSPPVDPAADMIAELKKQMEGVSLEPTPIGEHEAIQKAAPVSTPIETKTQADPAADLIANLKKQMEGVSLEPTPTGEQGEN